MKAQRDFRLMCAFAGLPYSANASRLDANCARQVSTARRISAGIEVYGIPMVSQSPIGTVMRLRETHIDSHSDWKKLPS